MKERIYILVQAIKLASNERIELSSFETRMGITDSEDVCPPDVQDNSVHASAGDVCISRYTNGNSINNVTSKESIGKTQSISKSILNPDILNTHIQILHYSNDQGFPGKLIFDDQPSPTDNGLHYRRRKRKTSKKEGRKGVHIRDLKSLQILDPEPEKFNKNFYKGLPKVNNKKSNNMMKRVNDARSSSIVRTVTNVQPVQDAKKSLVGYVRKSKYGEIALREKMLVMVKAADSCKEAMPSFSETELIDTRILDRWKEYIVVARKTGDFNAPLILQFYHSRKISKTFEERHIEKSSMHGSSLDFFLDRNCVVNFYSSLDKTICVQKPDKKISEAISNGTTIKYKDVSSLKIYILRCRTIRSSENWYSFLQEALNLKKIPRRIPIHVPDANIIMNISITRSLSKFICQLTEQENCNLKISVLERGYKIFQSPFLRYVSVAIFEELKRSDELFLIKEWEQTNVILGCDLRRYDRIEWCPVHYINILRTEWELMKTHILEYRPFTNYPRLTSNLDGSKIVEPLPIEGFLIKYTNKYGREWSSFSKLYLKPSYFFTNENFLFYMSAFKTVPPLPIESSFDNLGDLCQLDRDKEIIDSLPYIYEQDPYHLELDGHISWLNENTTSTTFNKNDLYAFKCFNRRVAQILKSEGILDLTKVNKICQGELVSLKNNELKYSILKSANFTFWERRAELDDTVRSTILIETSDNLKLKLLAPSPIIAHEWVESLSNMVTYWKQRQIDDTKKMWSMKTLNLKNLKIAETEEANICENTPKWVSDRGLADPTLFNVNALSLLRPLIQKGILYWKPKKHSIFSKYFVILIPGFILLFNCFHRSTTGFAKKVVDYEHYMTIPIDECYLYSGTTTEPDLLKRDHTFDFINPGNHALPRAYNDGWKSTEKESSRCFTLWIGSKRAISNYSLEDEHVTESGHSELNSMKKKTEKDKGFKKDKKTVRVVNRLGVNGKSMVFMARSRQERDIWVLALYYELERIKNASDHDS